MSETLSVRRLTFSVAGMLLLIGLALPETVTAGAGTSEAGELDLPVSALSAAVGGRSAGLVDDASAVTDNPARLGVAAPAGGAATHTVWPLGFSDSMVALFFNAPGVGTIGGEARVFRANLPETTEDAYGNFADEVGEYQYETTRLALACAPDLGFLKESLPFSIRAGAAVFTVRREVAGEKANGLGANAGVSAGVGRNLEIYGIGRNIGGIGSRMLPSSATAGVLGRFPYLFWTKDRLTGAAEAEWSRESGIGGGVAAEYMVWWSFMEAGIRTGYSLSVEKRAGELPSVGVVFRISHLSVEFGLASLGDLGQASVLSLSYQERDSR